MPKEAVQDDQRQREMLLLFNMERPPDAGRAGVDALLRLDDGSVLEFELKSSTNTRGSVSTVRDFGPDHIAKWRNKHWLFSFYDKTGEDLRYSLYGSPRMMAPWIQTKEKYVKLDFLLAEHLPHLLTLEVMYRLLGKKDVYTYQDAFDLHKKQYRATKYKSQMDVGSPAPREWKQGGGYTPERMLTIVQARAQYLIRRGSTLNNPHIDPAYFAGWPQITSNHAATLRRLVADELAKQAGDGDGPL
jgi:hypothetical protein